MMNINDKIFLNVRYKGAVNKYLIIREILEPIKYKNNQLILDLYD